MSKRVAVYARVSTTRQAENDISIPDQLAQARRHCAQRAWHVIAEFVDAGASARDDKRPDFQRMMETACVDPSPFDVVLVHSQSRFFRETGGYVAYKNKLQKHGVSLVSMTQDFGVGPSADFAETIIAASDALHSAETAKHVCRTMLENARQGFWNGSIPPFGYRAVAVEQRGQRLKKRLQIEPKEAETVRLIFKLFLEGDGVSGPMGVMEVANWLNARGFRNKRGNRYFTSCVHRILTRETYAGTHYYNRTDTRSGRERPREEWIATSVAKIITPDKFQLVQTMLYARRPSVTAPRVTNSPLLLAGIARCEACGAPLMLRTGKSGRYRYYACASHRLKGKSTCSDPIAISANELEQLTLTALTDRLLAPERLPKLMSEALKHRKELATGNIHRRSELRRRLKDVEAQIERLHTAVAEGTVPDSSLLRDKLSSLHARRMEYVRLLSLLDVGTPPLRRVLSKQQAVTMAGRFKRALLDAPPQLQRRYLQGLVSEVVVDHERAVIRGSRAAIASAIASKSCSDGVLTSIRKWRALGESNPSCKIENLES